MPNTSFEIYAPNFLEKFLEAHTVMFQGNSGLKPKEGEITSQPWQWPINIKVHLLFFVYFVRWWLYIHQGEGFLQLLVKLFWKASIKILVLAYVGGFS